MIKIKHRLTDIDCLIPYVGSIILILISSFIYPQVLSFGYLLQQLQIASFLGVLAIGATVVILLGHIDLSVPWVLGGGAIISTAIAANTEFSMFAIPAAIMFGAFIGVINGFGVSVLRIPSMVWTLAVNSMLLGISVVLTGGFNPRGEASEIMSALSTGKILNIPIVFCIWLMISILIYILLNRSNFGKYVFSIGYNEKATFLSGISTSKVIIFAFIIAGVCSSFGGVLLAGYANQAYQSMGEPFLLPTIAAVVIGGTSILGGKGSIVGTIGGVLFITLLNSILSIMQISDAWRNINFGLIIILMLLFQSIRMKKEAI